MEWAVMWRSGARNLGRSLIGANGPERERQIGRPESVTAPVETRL
jgi:hypothetical protein